MANTNDLGARLASVLPQGHKFTTFHISTPPKKTNPLYSPPPNERPERTYCENHFLAVSIDAPNEPGKQVLVLGIEVFIYTTARSTTLFVSKADSTGYLALLNLPKGTPSPIREICATFVGFLVEKRRRKDIQFVVNLFARAQDQYLFPGSVDNKGKHVLDDRGLIKWWCRVLDPLLGPAPKSTEAPWKSANGYIVVPGLETYETRALTPRKPESAWEFTHPLERISHYYREFDWVPPRCLIPHFPDDPKSRFRDELDEEAASSQAMKNQGSWKSVKTLDMFWEMMAYRQECSSGRMTGFIWLVFDDQEPASKLEDSRSTAPPETPKKQRIVQITPTTTPRKLFPSKEKKDSKIKKKKTKKTLKGPIIARAPRIKRAKHNYLLDRPTNTAYYSWTPQGRGERIFDEAAYKRIVDLLLHLDFATLNKAVGSTRRWLSEGGGGGKWGVVVVGTRETPVPVSNDNTGVNNLTGLVKRKRTDSTVDDNQSKVNVLSAGLVKKKPKEESKDVNVLPTGLIRKKPKEESSV
ncbi:regulator-ty1 transposition 109 [Fusarium sporotrichioides]|uniref:histone acetyltransferase n=1 Tax=Fusarium sporotrichioides TaxID=5514 RepID=A0A395S9X4_FUSSP|nr:regulator-ty1 transposition 109 [Fusarium sporotrichioides]